MFDHNSKEWNDWQWQLRNTLGVAQLRELLPDWDFTDSAAVNAAFSIKVSPYYFELLCASNAPVALRRMCLPDRAELDDAGFPVDPFGESDRNNPLYGVKQRFSDRILVMASASCALNCRHCTRKGILRSSDLLPVDALEQAIGFVIAHPAIREVLISGGDPLMLPDESVLRFVNAFTGIDQIDAVRLCTRMPVTLPMRLTRSLIERLAASGKLWVNTQFNHVAEITTQSAAVCRLLVDAGIPVSNQSVLLRGVNDSAEEMFRLCAALQRIRVRPYYVFQCDPVAGIEHFRVERTIARSIEKQLAARIGGLAMPRFVEDLPGSEYKQPLI